MAKTKKHNSRKRKPSMPVVSVLNECQMNKIVHGLELVDIDTGLTATRTSARVRSRKKSVMDMATEAMEPGEKEYLKHIVKAAVVAIAINGSNFDGVYFDMPGHGRLPINPEQEKQLGEARHVAKWLTEPELDLLGEIIAEYAGKRQITAQNMADILLNGCCNRNKQAWDSAAKAGIRLLASRIQKELRELRTARYHANGTWMKRRAA